MLSMAEGNYHAKDLAEALGITERSVYSRYTTRRTRFNRAPTIAELTTPLHTPKDSQLKRFKLGNKWLTAPELATLTNLPESVVRQRYAALAKRHPKGFTIADLLRIRTRKTRAMTPRNKLLIERAEKGESFTELGIAFGISRQAAQQIYKRGY